MRFQLVAKWRASERLPAKLPGFKRIAFPLLEDVTAQSGLRGMLNEFKSRKWAPCERAIDVAALAFSVYTADMSIPRVMSQDSWTREIALSVPVSDVDVWTAQTSAVTRLLNYLTGDRWFLSFRQRDALPLYETTTMTSPDCVSLFSGGLDSFVGALDVLGAGKRVLLVSHAGEGVTSGVQHEIHRALQKKYPDQIDYVRVWFAPHPLLDEATTEKSMRGRSFLFFGAAVAVAASQADNTLEVLIPENGFISLNVPLDPLRLGALSTRTTHPFVLKLWNELLQALELGVQLRNPYQFSTKGEMFTQCLDSELLKRQIPNTMSCSSPSKARWQGIAAQHCGHCVPCIIRRAAIQRAFKNDKTEYTVDIKTESLDSTKAEGRNVRAFQRAIKRNSDSRIASIVVHSAGPLPRDPRFATTYINGLAEVGKLVGSVVSKPGA